MIKGADAAKLTRHHYATQGPDPKKLHSHRDTNKSAAISPPSIRVKRGGGLPSLDKLDRRVEMFKNLNNLD